MCLSLFVFFSTNRLINVEHFSELDDYISHVTNHILLMIYSDFGHQGQCALRFVPQSEDFFKI